MKQTCILVLGMHRSGTSALSGVLNTLGISMGKQLLVTKTDNPKGHFENERIMYFNDQTLFPKLGTSWDDLKNITCNIEEEEIISTAKILLEEDYSGEILFGIKDPRMSLLFPFWKRILSQKNIEAKVILPYRNPLEVALSLKTRDGFSLEKGLLLWTRHVLHAEYYSRGFKRVFTSYSSLLSDTLITLKQIEKNLDIQFPLSIDAQEVEITSFLEKDMKHHEKTVVDLPTELPSFILGTVLTYQQLCDGDIKDDKSVLEQFDIYRKDYKNYSALFYNEDITKQLQFANEATCKLVQLDTLLNPPLFIQLFIDQGIGFNEENSINFPIIQNRDVQEFIFDVSKISNIKGLRLDPLNDACVIEIKQLLIITEKNQVNFLSSIVSNESIHYAGRYFYHTNDSQIYFKKYKFANIQKIVVHICYKKIGKEALNDICAELLEKKNGFK